MIMRVRDPTASVVPVLENWVQEGNQIEHSQLHKFITDLLPSRIRFNQALQMLQWMSDKGGYELSAEDFAVQLELTATSRVDGIEQVEMYFNAIPNNLRGCEVYCALLKSYAHHGCFKKGVATMEKLREMGDKELSEESREGSLNEVYLYMIRCLSLKNDMDSAERFWEEWFSKKKEMDFEIPRVMISGYARRRQWEKAEGIVLRMRKSGIEPDADTLHRLAYAYERCKQMDKAVEALVKEISVSKSGWIPVDLYTFSDCFKYLERKGDDVAKEELYKMLRERSGVPTWLCRDLKNCKHMSNGCYKDGCYLTHQK